jgi:hypothetical protein
MACGRAFPIVRHGAKLAKIARETDQGLGLHSDDMG